MKKELISPKQASLMVGVSTATLRLWAEAGKLSAVRTLGGQRRYKLNDIKNIIENSNK